MNFKFTFIKNNHSRSSVEHKGVICFTPTKPEFGLSGGQLNFVRPTHSLQVAGAFVTHDLLGQIQ